jgi:AcrR family transcriptional regulator
MEAVESTSDAHQGTGSGRRARKKAETRERLIESATRLFLQKGYEATSVEEITEAADLSPATFYAHFPTKSDVAMARLDQWLDDMFAGLSARPLGEGPDEMLMAAFADMTRKGYEGLGIVRDFDGNALPPVPLAALFADPSPEVAGRLFQSFIRGQERLTIMFRNRMGLPPENLEPRIIAAMYFATTIVSVYGFAEVLERDPNPGAPTDLALQAITAYMDGIRAVIERTQGKAVQPEA